MPEIAFGASAWVDDIAELLAARVAAAAGLPPDRVFPWFGKVEALFALSPPEKFVVVGGPHLRVSPKHLTGGGSAHSVWEGRFPVHACGRLAADREHRDFRTLRDKSKGLARHAFLTARALQQYAGVDGLASKLVEPLVVGGADFAPRTAPDGWGFVTLDVAAVFRTDFTP